MQFWTGSILKSRKNCQQRLQRWKQNYPVMRKKSSGLKNRISKILLKMHIRDKYKSEFMEKTMMDKKTQKIGVICSIVQIILSIICLIYSAINQENIIMWVLFLCSGILSLSSNISRNNKKEDE